VETGIFCSFVYVLIALLTYSKAFDEEASNPQISRPEINLQKLLYCSSMTNFSPVDVIRGMFFLKVSTVLKFLRCSAADGIVHMHTVYLHLLTNDSCHYGNIRACLHSFIDI
jgi:hypothetical protein